jgi:LuxR family maltose regulon positive regulatory protein
LGHLGSVKTALGELNAARSAYLQALEYADRPEGEKLAFYGISHVGLGNLYYERNDLKSAQRELERGIALGRLWNSWEVLLPGYAGMVALYCTRREFDLAKEVLDQAARLAKHALFPVQPQIDTWQAQVWLAQGKTAKAAAWTRSAGYDLDRPDSISPTYPEHTLILGCLSLAIDQVDIAVNLLQEQVETCRAAGYWHMWLKNSTLFAVALDVAGQRREALQVLKSALERAQPHGYVRSFIDHGRAMADLLKGCLDNKNVGDYARFLLDAFPASPASTSTSIPGLVEPLSPREAEILELLANGLTNPEIAERAYISINTVKKHITSIYGKLGVSSRLQAVERARQLKLLNN